jgi:diacylglycerol kinase family enzyme
VRVSLLYNERAGGSATLARIRKALESHGHDLVRVVAGEADAARLLDPPAELAVTAGGDGTVAAAARALARAGMPLAILPLGTANNIARSMGCLGSIEELVESWDPARRRPFDLGVARGPWGERLIVEGVGGGLIAAGIQAMNARGASRTSAPAAKLERAVRMYLEVLARLEPCACQLRLDGALHAGRLLLVEVLNIPAVGPNFDLSPEADPSDGAFTVVIAGEDDRDALADYLRRRLVGRACRLRLATYRAHRIDIRGLRTLHLDDQVHGAPPDEPVSVRMQPAAVEILESRVDGRSVAPADPCAGAGHPSAASSSACGSS